MVFPVGGQRRAGLGVALESWPRSQEALLPTALPQKQWKSETFSSLCFHCKQRMKAGPSPPGCSAASPSPPGPSLPGLWRHLSCPLCPYGAPPIREARCPNASSLPSLIEVSSGRDSSAPSLGGSTPMHSEAWTHPRAQVTGQSGQPWPLLPACSDPRACRPRPRLLWVIGAD